MRREGNFPVLLRAGLAGSPRTFARSSEMGLAEMSADDVALLGARRVGGVYVEEIDIVRSKGRRARGAVARHVGMAARLDVEGKDPTGEEGREMMQRIREDLDGACSDDGACFDGNSSGIATVCLRVRTF
ncbi:uncharacterized protein A4U43_C07F35640 [Asparagus officinalis]|uniref:Uncharacterized protein n=1 Tax=Asparagus officinalis TaxID=4686 RepID=A0A5P1EHS5_ASPOF|nr:uncharacterized protein A4U43_C07F35640 [Asparagus officinalis]